jgi:hypothetical protein
MCWRDDLRPAGYWDTFPPSKQDRTVPGNNVIIKNPKTGEEIVLLCGDINIPEWAIVVNPTVHSIDKDGKPFCGFTQDPISTWPKHHVQELIPIVGTKERRKPNCKACEEATPF